MTRFDPIADVILHLTPQDIPAAAQAAAAQSLLDTLGVMAAATPMTAGRIARDTAHALYASADPGWRARLPFDGRPVSAAGAAFAAATQTDNLDAHDGYNPVKGHIGAAVIPALLALSETAPTLSGPQALSLVTIGYEIAGRAGRALHDSVSDYHTSGAWNALGVAAMGARLRKLGRDALRQALGIAEFHGPRSQMMREIANPTMLHDGSGMGALVGVSAVVLAEQGFTGAPAITVEDAEMADVWGDLGQHWLITQQYIKPYPICRWAHAPIDALRQIMHDHALVADDIARIRIRTFAEAAALFAGAPQTTSQAQYSLPFAVAVQAAHGSIGVAQITGAGLSDPAVDALRRRITVTRCDRHQALFPAHRTADVQVITRDGQRFASGIVHARGGTTAPLAPSGVEDKFMAYAAPTLGTPRARRLRHAVRALQDPGSGFDAIARLVFEPPG
ncbi:MAG: MmgE/PrpD family protein [Marinibacterium sp.]|nr:MmgE/PrpD family protein [Marinibacterium sp.]